MVLPVFLCQLLVATVYAAEAEKDALQNQQGQVFLEVDSRGTAMQVGTSLLELQRGSSAPAIRSDLAERTQVLVLTTNDEMGKTRIAALQKALDDQSNIPPLPFKTVFGQDYTSFKNQAEMMNAFEPLLSERAKEQWRAYQIKIGKGDEPDGQLACALGHRRMWHLAAANAEEWQWPWFGFMGGVVAGWMSGNLATGPSHVPWTIVLEDDVKPTGFDTITVLAKVPNYVDIVFLDSAHCRGFAEKRWIIEKKTVDGFVIKGQRASGELEDSWSSAAYAVSPAAARVLLNMPFNHNADHALNAAIRGSLTAFCPWDQPFTVLYEHESHINRGQQSYQ